MNESAIIAASVGNTSIQCGLFRSVGGPLPVPEWQQFASGDEELPLDWLDPFGVDELADATWCVASVNHPAEQRLREFVGHRCCRFSYRLLSHEDLPIHCALEHPERVGLDRLAAAVAVNAIRPAEQSAIVVDTGTAITVNAIDAAGRFCGGSILPGPGISLRVLESDTEQLPRLALSQLDHRPNSIGKNTHDAIHGGVYWGTVGAVRELVARFRQALGGSPVCYLTGGFARTLSRELPDDFEVCQHLVLSGIALASRTSSGKPQ